MNNKIDGKIKQTHKEKSLNDSNREARNGLFRDSKRTLFLSLSLEWLALAAKLEQEETNPQRKITQQLKQKRKGMAFLVLSLQNKPYTSENFKRENNQAQKMKKNKIKSDLYSKNECF